MSKARLIRDERGASAVEFALAVPVLLGLIIGLVQMGVLFGANAGLQQAVNEGARYATLYPRPTDVEISKFVSSKKFMLATEHIVGPSIVHGTNNGVAYAEITMSYSVPLDFVLFPVKPVTLTQTRRAYQN